ncbi:ATPase [Nakamurella sp. YIM 132087]|uniref:ATPase n=1 Tax=Nakamurella alba TaxID=2665158 RepID=A0A7K1FJY9_9ACTN|nr:SRPBCC family protein [Nakamurella alba]MTD14418.1 ATPase [Nakamurella alba]
MTPTPTGRVIGTDLVLTRQFAGPIEDVWASVTDPERTARWIGRWEGGTGAGSTGRLQLGFEESAPWSDFTITACEPPRHVAVATADDAGQWRLEITLEQQDTGTLLTFVHHLDDTDGVGDIGPGWEYYLDQLVASREGRPLPDFGDYHPAMSEHFAAQVRY